MPAPVDSVAQKGIKITSIYPAPKDIFFEPKGNRIILSTDSDINLGYGRGVVPWFHMPHENSQQEEGSALILTVELLGIEEKPGY